MQEFKTRYLGFLKAAAPKSCPVKARGFTLIEMVIAMALTSILGISLAQLLTSSNNAQQSQRILAAQQALVANMKIQLTQDVTQAESIVITGGGSRVTLFYNDPAYWIRYIYTTIGGRTTITRQDSRTFNTILNYREQLSPMVIDSLVIRCGVSTPTPAAPPVTGPCFSFVDTQSSILQLNNLSIVDISPMNNVLSQVLGNRSFTVPEIIFTKPNNNGLN